ncbi:MAG: hypothetical protein RRZ84_00120 [Romboutsia sp.]
MKSRGGYLLLESVMSLAIISTIVAILYTIIFLSSNIKTSLEDKVELQQQAIEISRHIEEVIGNSMGIISITPKDNNNETLRDVVSIKCKYKDSTLNPDSTIKNKEISLKKDLDKLFINTVTANGISESGGYEIGDYIDNLYIGMSDDNKCANILLKLSKNNQTYETKFRVYIRNFKGDAV